MSHLTLLIVQDDLTNGLVVALPGFAVSSCTTTVATTCGIATVPPKLQDFFPAKQVEKTITCVQVTPQHLPNLENQIITM